MTLGELWARAGLPKLKSLERLGAVFGEQLAARANEMDGALNPLVRSLCGESSWAELWERALGWLPPNTWREHFASTLQKTGCLGTVFDGRILDAWAELEAINRFVGISLEIEVELLASGADFQLRQLRSGRTVLVEVKRASGLADELRLAAEGLRAGQLLFRDVESQRIAVWGTEAYHEAQFDKRGKPLSDVVAELKKLLHREHYANVMKQVGQGSVVQLSADMILAEREDGDSGVSIQPYTPKEVQAKINTMGILHATGDIFLKARRAMPQLYTTAASIREETPLTLSPYVYYDAWELVGVDLGRLNEYLDVALGFDHRVGLIIDSFGDQWFFGRNLIGQIASFEHPKPWLDQLDAKQI